MAIDFPDSPSVNDYFTAAGRTWKWDGSVWSSVIGGTNGAFATTDYADEATAGSDGQVQYNNGDAAKTSAGDWTAISDDRLKIKGDSVDPDETLAAMMTLDPTWHQFHTDASFTGESDENGVEGVDLIERDEPTAPAVGFMASDLEQAFPHLIKYKGEDNIRLVPTGQYDALLTASIISLGNKNEALESLTQQQQTTIEALEQRIAALESA